MIASLFAFEIFLPLTYWPKQIEMHFQEQKIKLVYSIALRLHWQMYVGCCKFFIDFKNVPWFVTENLFFCSTNFVLLYIWPTFIPNPCFSNPQWDKSLSNCIILHGGLYRWRENSLPFFLYQKLKEILTRYSRTILTASKDRLISKIWRVWLKNWARHAHLNFEV